MTEHCATSSYSLGIGIGNSQPVLCAGREANDGLKGKALPVNRSASVSCAQGQQGNSVAYLGSLSAAEHDAGAQCAP